MDALSDYTQKNVIILGFHKSGTSATAGILDILGVHMGRKLRGADSKNPKGYFEDVRFLQLNDAILEDACGSAWDPPSVEEIRTLREEYASKVLELVNTRKREATLWGWKATTTCLTIDHFTPHLENPHVITVFRNPLGIAPSAVEHTRGRVEFLDSIRLANHYNDQIVGFLKNHPDIPKHFVSFEKLVSDPVKEGAALAAFLKVGLSEVQIQRIRKFIIPRSEIKGAKRRMKLASKAKRLFPKMLRKAIPFSA